MYELSLSGAVLCYGPLIVMILGFIAFAWITDVDARRTYLRRMELRPETEVPEVLPPVVTKKTTAKTPSGSWVTIIPGSDEASGSGTVTIDGGSGTAVAEAPAEEAPAAEEEAEAAEAEAPAPEDTDTTEDQREEAEDDATSGEPDDLTVIEGIGPKMTAALAMAGITTYAQLAAASEDDLRAAVENAGMRLAPSIPTWAEQASFAAKGDWDGLQALQDELEGGRRVDTDDDGEN